MGEQYLIDNKNRLVIKRGKEKIIPRGEFQIDEKNRLLYLLKEPSNWRRKYNLPAKIVFTGKWKLNKNHDLVLDISKEDKPLRKRTLILKGQIISTNCDQLAFYVKSQQNGIERIRILKLKGRWLADKYNRLNFMIEKKGQPEALIFKNAWEINSNQKITYIYEKTYLKTKTKTQHTFTLEGFWQINKKNRLTYYLLKGSHSRIEFRIQLGTPSIRPQEGLIKYRVGIGVRKKKTKIISLYGKWQIGKNGNLEFLMEYEKGKIKKIQFGLEVKFTDKSKIQCLLTNTRKEPLGLTITFTRRFLEQASSFLKLKYSQKEKRIEGGLKIPF